MTNDESKSSVILSLINQIESGEFEAKLNAQQVLKELIEANKNFNFKDP